MTPPDLRPVGTKVESSRPLELDFHAQQQLVADLSQTAKELESSPLVKPYYREARMGRIPLLSELRQSAGTNRLWISFSETSDGQRNAVMQTQIGPDITEFRLANSNEAWDIYFKDGGRQPVKPLSNPDMVSFLDNRLRKDHVFDAVADSLQFDGMTIPHLAYDNLYADARDQEKQLIYTNNQIRFAGQSAIRAASGKPIIITPEYLANVDTYFVASEKDGTSKYQLVTRANYDIGGQYGTRQVQKEYSYTAETSHNRFTRSMGKVAMSSRDGLSREQVDEFARYDQERNEPIYSLNLGLNDLRNSKGLRKIA